MPRRLFAIFSGASLLLCVAVGVLWLQSYWTEDWLVYEGGGRYHHLSARSSAGRIYLALGIEPDPLGETRGEHSLTPYSETIRDREWDDRLFVRRSRAWPEG